MKKAAAIFAALIGSGVLYIANPEHTAWFPVCRFYQLTGLQCPACGTQRALHQLLHLNFSAAFYYNPFLTVSLPYVLALAYFKWFYSGKKLQKAKQFCFHHTTVNIYLLLIIVWWIARNIWQVKS